jgi:hypothetical protein
MSYPSSYVDELQLLGTRLIYNFRNRFEPLGSNANFCRKAAARCLGLHRFRPRFLYVFAPLGLQRMYPTNYIYKLSYSQNCREIHQASSSS